MEGKCQRCHADNCNVSKLVLSSDVKVATLMLCNVCFEEARRLWVNFMEPQEEQGEFTDESTMYFGVHEGKKMKDVPAQYLIWCGDQKWIQKYPRVHKYIEKCRAALEEEIANDS